MKEKKPKKSITIGGLKLQIEENPKKIENKHKKFFIHLLNRLVSIQERTDKVFTEYGLNLIMYEDLYFQVIEDMVYEHNLVNNMMDEVIGYRNTLNLINDLENFENYLPTEVVEFWKIYRKQFKN